MVLVREVNSSLRGNDKDRLLGDVVPSPSDPCNVRETTEEEEEEEEEEEVDRKKRSIEMYIKTLNKHSHFESLSYTHRLYLV